MKVCYKVVKTFDENKGIKFITYATTVITNKFLKELKENSKGNQISANSVRLDSYVTEDGKCKVKATAWQGYGVVKAS